MSILVELSGGCYEDCERLPLPKALGSIASAFFVAVAEISFNTEAYDTHKRTHAIMNGECMCLADGNIIHSL